MELSIEIKEFNYDEYWDERKQRVSRGYLSYNVKIGKAEDAIHYLVHSM